MHLKIKPLNTFTEEFYKNHNYNLKGDCGYDLGLAADTKVYFKATTKINLQVVIVGWNSEYDVDYNSNYTEDRFPVDYLVVARSSISKLPLRISNAIGTIDRNYRGSLQVALDYLDIRTEQSLAQHVEPETGFIYSILPKGTRIVQIIAPIFYNINSTEIVEEHDTTNRGTNGFGSTRLGL